MNGIADSFTLSAPSSSFTTARDSPDNGYAFLNHSQASLGRLSPPEVDDLRLARQKRRRTSPEDQAILEAEFARGSKPDKSKRLELVKRVALGEKEVQIWFQNRRQLSRRKSRPSETQDSEESIGTSQSHTTTDCTSISSVSATEPSLRDSSQSSAPCSQESLVESQRDQPCHGEEIHHVVDSDSRVFESRTDSKTRFEGICQTFKMDSAGNMRPRQPADTFDSITNKKRPGYLANRRSASFIIHEDRDGGSTQTSFSSSQEDIVERENQIGTDEAARSLKRVASLVKLSMDADGKAEVTPRSGDTPSPPRISPFLSQSLGPRRFLGLQRSLSATNTPTSRRGLQRSTTNVSQSVGRSKDARTWEFYCDSNARDELIKQAERVESGSAAAAIGLLRSQSNNKKPLTPSQNKRNAQVSSRDSLKRSKTDLGALKRAKLERTISSVARLQTTSDTQAKLDAQKLPSKHHKSMSQSAAIFEDFEGDSDKENWQPGTQTRPEARRRPAQSQSSSRILLENVRELSHSSKVSDIRERRGPQRRLTGLKTTDKENSMPLIDDEVAEFMGHSSLVREEEDLDCVQNLLSLSQGPWA